MTDSGIPVACDDHAFTSIPHEAAIDLIAGLGFDGFKLVLLEGRSHVRPRDVRQDVAGWAARIDERVRGRGLEIVDVACVPDPPSMAINDPSDATREAFRDFVSDMIEFVARLRAPTMMLPCGRDFESESHQASFDRMVDELKPYVAAAGERGITLTVEPHEGSVCESVEDALRLAEAVPGLRLAVDYSQFVVQGIADSEVDALLPYAGSVHARGASPGRMLAPLHDSVIDYDRIVDQLITRQFSGSIAVEVFSDPLHSEVDVVSEVVAVRDLLRGALASNIR